MKIFTLLCAALGENIYNGAARASFWKELHARPGKSLFPALTCPAQATLRTAELPAQHGMIASGFYDRMLAEYPGRKVGVFYQCQYSEELLPHAEHDQSLALAVTEDKVYKF